MITIAVNGVDYEVPSDARDTNWAAKQIAFEQALAAGVNGGASGTVADVIITSAGFTIPSTANVNIIHSLSSAISVTSAPSITAGTVTGQRLQLFNLYTTGTSITLRNAGASGLNLKTATVVLGDGDSLELIWDGSQWTEISRDLGLGGGSTFGDITVDTVTINEELVVGQVAGYGIEALSTDTTATPGNVDGVTTMRGRSAIKIGEGSVVFTSMSVMGATSQVIPVLESSDATVKSLRVVSSGPGTFTVESCQGNAAADCIFSWVIFGSTQ